MTSLPYLNLHAQLLELTVPNLHSNTHSMYDLKEKQKRVCVEKIGNNFDQQCKISQIKEWIKLAHLVSIDCCIMVNGRRFGNSI